MNNSSLILSAALAAVSPPDVREFLIKPSPRDSWGLWDMPTWLSEQPFVLPEEMDTEELRNINRKIMVAAELEEQQKIERAIAKRAKKNKSKL